MATFKALILGGKSSFKPIESSEELTAEAYLYQEFLDDSLDELLFSNHPVFYAKRTKISGVSKTSDGFIFDLVALFELPSISFEELVQLDKQFDLANGVCFTLKTPQNEQLYLDSYTIQNILI